MPTFKYIEMTGAGKRVEGRMEAASKSDVLTSIKGRASIPISIEEVAENEGGMKLSFGKKKIKPKELSVFSKQLYTMLNAGMPLLSCIDALKDQVQNKTLKEALTDVYQQLQKGEIFSVALEKHKNVFPPLYLSMVKSGELTGNLDMVLDNLSIHYEKDAKLQSQIKSAMIYPVVLLFASVAVTVLLIVKLIPMFQGMFEGRSLPGITRFVVGLSNLLINRWYIIIAIIAAIFFGFKAYKSTPAGKLTLDTMKLSMPVIKKYIKIIISARFASTLAVLLSSGIPILQAIQSAAEITNNTYVIKKMDTVLDNIKKGSPMSFELKKLELFPPMMISMIKIGEESGAIDTMLNKTSEFYEDELEEAVKKMSSMLEPAMIVIMGGMVAMVLLSIYLPMFEMSTNPNIG